MGDFRQEHPRIMGAVLLIIGLLGALWAYNAYKTGGEIESVFLAIIPICLIYGGAIIAEPRLSLNDGSDDRTFKIVAAVIIGVGLIIGLYIRFVIFKEWQ